MFGHRQDLNSASGNSLLLFIWISACTAFLHILIFAVVSISVGQHGGSMTHIIDTQDEGEYIEIAQSLLASGEFRINGAIETETFRTPLYPSLAALILALTGGWFWSVYILHALATGVTAGATAWIAASLGLPRKWSIAAGLLFGLSSGPISLTVSGMGSDKLFPMFFSLAAGLVLTFSAQSPSIRAIYIGLLLGFATLVRPIGILASLPILFGTLVVPPREIFPDFASRMKVLLLSAFVFALVLIPWCLRNYVVAEHFSLSSLPTYNFVYYNMPIFLSYHNGTTEEDERNFILDRLGRPNLMTLRGFAYHEELSAIQKEFLDEHAVRYGFFHVYRTIPFFLGSGFNVAHVVVATESPSLRSSLFPTEQENLTSAILRGDIATVRNNLLNYPLVTLERILWLLIFALVFLSPLFAKGMVRRTLLLFCFIILSFAFLSSPVIQPRYRVPAEPFIWICAVYSVYGFLEWRKRRPNSTLST